VTRIVEMITVAVMIIGVKDGPKNTSRGGEAVFDE
jgi:hypothetical protein